MYNRNKDFIMDEQMKQFAEMISKELLGATKKMLTTDEAAEYLGVTKSYLYKLTSNLKIPHYKPSGKMCYFKREELDEWMQQNRCATDIELNDKALAYCRKA